MRTQHNVTATSFPRRVVAAAAATIQVAPAAERKTPGFGILIFRFYFCAGPIFSNISFGRLDLGNHDLLDGALGGAEPSSFGHFGRGV